MGSGVETDRRLPRPPPSILEESLSVLFHSRPFSGALFPSVISPQKVLDGLSQVASPHILLFHEKRGLVLFPPVLRDIWPGVELGLGLNDFRLFTEDGIVPAERQHLTDFWTNFPKEGADCGEMFVIKAGRIRQVFMLGFVVWRFSFGSLVVIVPGENSRELGGRIADYRRWMTPGLAETVTAWVEDSDRESLMGSFLDGMPAEFRNMAVVERPVAGGSSDRWPSYRLMYRMRGGEWQRDAVVLEETTPGALSRDVRMSGKVVDGEVAISFSVYTGGIRSLGTLSLPVSRMAEAGMARLNLFLNQSSSILCEQSRETVLPEFSYCRHWERGGYRLEEIREIVRSLPTETPESLPVLPLWFPGDRDSLHLLKAIDRARYATDILFLDKGIRSGCLLLQNVTMEKAPFVREKLLREKTLVTIDAPITLEEFLQTL